MQELQETLVPCLGPEDPLEEEVATHPSILPWRIPLDGGAWGATVHRLRKSRTQLKRLSLHTTGSQLAKEKCTESQPAPQSNV